MKTVIYLLLCAVMFGSCQKEINYIDSSEGNGGNSGGDSTGNNGGGDSAVNNLIGTWNFVSINAATQSITEFDSAGLKRKTVADLNYITEKNAGIIVIDDSLMNTAGLTYSIASSIKSFTYNNDILTDSSQAPFNLLFPESESISKYKLIGADSIYFVKGMFTNIAASTLRTDPAAAKISFNDNLLTFTQAIYKDSTENKAGINYHIVQTGTATITLQKK